ncbi:transmembrane protein, putative [Bodo saltans]|uniref:Transmembrane protein, putative n=1 Tax=Bodo saltans TaxID=75058 RepID=A0A0S4JFD1_BODSA|nr:transmembrane protein, putative [Bodo saltans]|eukprot:CUG89168.1 transmembrane protein, putative [Bodo saltans]
MSITTAPMTVKDYDVLEVRLKITVVCGSISIIAGIFMLAVYRRYRQQLSSTLNDLYVLGLGGMQLLQTVQFVIFAVIHLHNLHDYSGIACAANAMLDQFFNFSGQMFALGFSATLFTLRGHFDCCTHKSLSLTQQSRGSFLPLSRSQHFLQRNYGSKLEEPQHHDDAFFTSPSVITPRGGGGEVHPVERAPLSSLGDGALARIVWTVLAIAGGLGTTVWMSVVVMQNVDAAPEDHVVHPTNFEIGLGWCWIPNGYDTLKLFCCYLLAFMTLLSGITAIIFLLRHEVGSSYQLHLMIYVRVGLLLSWLLFAYLIGAVSRFTKDHTATEQSSYVATALYTLNETFVVAIFLWTERMWSPLRNAFTHRFKNAPEELPGNGFSSCVNHLMLMVVEGVPLPTTNVASQENSRWRFDDSEAGGVDYSANSRRYLSSQRESLVITSHATTEALMTER